MGYEGVTEVVNEEKELMFAKFVAQSQWLITVLTSLNIRFTLSLLAIAYFPSPVRELTLLWAFASAITSVYHFYNRFQRTERVYGELRESLMNGYLFDQLKQGKE